MYSFKAPRKKSLFSRDSLLWIGFISIVSIALFTFGIYLFVNASGYQSKLEKMESSNTILSDAVMSYEKEMKILKMKETLSREVQASNVLLKNSIKNLFDLVPDQIVLTKVVMRKDTLDIEGLTPTKDAYNLLLEPPLKSIFNNSKVNFTFNGYVGRYIFKSMNSIIEEAPKEELNNGKE